MIKTNKVIYPYKINLGEISLNLLKEDFKELRKYDNFINIPNMRCRASLSFLGEEEGILFFSLSKCDDYNIAVSDFQKRVDKRSFLEKHQRVKQHSLFAIIPESNTLLVLFNHIGFRYLIPSLRAYLKLKINKEFSSELMGRRYNDNDVKELSKCTKQIIIQKAREKPIPYSVNNRGSSRRKLRNYIRRKEEVIQFNRLSGLKDSKILSIIRAFSSKNIYDKIIINTTTLGNFDILDEFIINYKCNIPTDDDQLSRLEEFKIEIKKIKQEHNTFFNDYQVPL